MDAVTELATAVDHLRAEADRRPEITGDDLERLEEAHDRLGELLIELRGV